ncbi:DUF4817 domain-containing protein [Nephila pilipes]|uniref:DUF4817 domain-containing protein n=1 Tax=Nephila pilipes TaxID=299642 RepID=A0A8X6M6Z3_NEPPI|nr:DUF4817 domain-containing protein [Nephila pilipes]
MERCTIEERVFIIEQYFKNIENLAATIRKFRAKYCRNSDSTSSTMKRVIEKSKQTGSSGVMLNTLVVQKQAVQMSISKQCMRLLAKAQEHQFGVVDKNCKISRSSLQRIYPEDLCLHAYKVQLTQELKPNDHTQRREFVEWITEHQHSNKTIFSDEAHFHLDCFINSQNCRVWGSENQHGIIEKQMHLQRVTV